jgi:hypothetical protein
MVLRTLPAKLVKTMRRIYRAHELKENTPPHQIPQRIREFFERLKSADRAKPDSADHRINTKNPGFRVRRMKLNGLNVIVKRTHDMEAERLIISLRKIVDEHNRINPNTSYILRKPKAYPIGEHFIAMSETTAPTVKEIIGLLNIDGRALAFSRPTPQGQKFLEKIQQTQQEFSIEQLAEKLRKSHHQLMKTAVTLRSTKEFWGYSSFLGPSNVIVAGYEKGKFIFVPLIDVY